MVRTYPVYESGTLVMVAESALTARLAANSGVQGFEYVTGPVTGAADLLTMLLSERELKDKLAALGDYDTEGLTKAQLVTAFLRGAGHTAYDRLEITELDVTTGTTTGGDPVEITGTGFSVDSAGTPTVTFGGDAATSIVVVSNTLITCETPAHAAGDVDVVVTNAHGTHTLPEAFTYS